MYSRTKDSCLGSSLSSYSSLCKPYFRLQDPELYTGLTSGCRIQSYIQASLPVPEFRGLSGLHLQLAQAVGPPSVEPEWTPVPIPFRIPSRWPGRIRPFQSYLPKKREICPKAGKMVVTWGSRIGVAAPAAGARDHHMYWVIKAKERSAPRRAQEPVFMYSRNKAGSTHSYFRSIPLVYSKLRFQAYKPQLRLRCRGLSGHDSGSGFTVCGFTVCGGFRGKGLRSNGLRLFTHPE